MWLHSSADSLCACKRHFQFFWMFTFILLFSSNIQAQIEGISCIGHINLSIDPISCTATLTPEMVDANSSCASPLTLTVKDNHGVVANNIFNHEDIGETYTYELCCGANCCWGTFTVEDKSPPVFQSCGQPATIINCMDLLNYPGPPLLNFTGSGSCDNASIILIDENSEKTDCVPGNDIIKTLSRTYVAEDKLGNKSDPCVVSFMVERITDPSLIKFPDDVMIGCTDDPIVDSTGVPYYDGTYGKIPLFPTPDEECCGIWVTLDETNYQVNQCSEKILRTWSVNEWYCSGDRLLGQSVQTVEVADIEGPTIACSHPNVGTYTGSGVGILFYTTSGYTCAANVELPPVTLKDDCSDAVRVDIRYPGGVLENSNGGAVSVPEGVHTVTYVAYDDCLNQSTCDLLVSVEDRTPPVTTCDEHTIITLTANGVSHVPATVFDESSFDDCGLMTRLARRMNPGCDCDKHHPKFEAFHHLGESQGHHYYLSHDAYTGKKAFQIAEAYGGYPVVLNSNAERRYVRDIVNANDPAVNYMIGLRDTGGGFIWEGDNSNFANWATGEPINANGNYVMDMGGNRDNWVVYDGEATAKQFVLEIEDPCGFSEVVFFCCDDAGVTEMVEFRTIDKWGNYNACMVEAEVQNKENYTIVPLPDITVSCAFRYDDLNVFGSIVGSIDDVEEIFIDDPLIQYSSQNADGYVLGGCASDITELTPEDAFSQCGNGTMKRIFVVGQGSPNEIEVVQKITVVNDVEFGGDIKWPQNYEGEACDPTELHPDNLPARFGYPQFEEGECSLVAAAITSEEIFQFDEDGGDSCFKILRQWTIIDWCQEDPLIPGAPLSWEGPLQVLKGNNSTPPDVSCEDVIVNSYGPDCNDIDIVAIANGVDDCTASSSLYWRYHLDLDNDGTIDESGEGTNTYEGSVPSGTHKLSWWAEDRCGNVSEQCMQMITTENFKEPTAICIYGIATELVLMDIDPVDGIFDTEMVMVTPEMVNNKSQDACGDLDVQLSFSPDVTDTLLIFGCDHIGIQDIQLWVTASNGMQSYCVTTIDVQDNNDQDLCPAVEPGEGGGTPGSEGGEGNSDGSDDTASITGTITTVDGNVVADVVISLEGSDEAAMSNSDGGFDLGAMDMGGDYVVVPSKNDNPLNGVTTLDLVLIQKHIVGVEKLDNPYYLIAADINNNGSVSASDLVELRKMILGIQSEFSNNTSWRFVRSDYDFLDPEFASSENFPEVYEINDLSSDMVVNFMAIKVGDINNTAKYNLGSGDQTSIRQKGISWSSIDGEYTQGNIVRQSVYANDEEYVNGMQFTIEHPGLRLLDIKSDLLGITTANYNDLNQNQTLLSWNSDIQVLIDSEQPVMEFVFEVTAEYLQLSEAIHLSSNVLENEMYLGIDNEISNIEIAWSSKTDGQLTVASLFPSEPNPWKEETAVRFFIPRSGKVDLNLIDISGKSVWSQSDFYIAGLNSFELDRSQIHAAGIYICQMKFEDSIQRKKMIIID